MQGLAAVDRGWSAAIKDGMLPLALAVVAGHTAVQMGHG